MKCVLGSTFIGFVAFSTTVFAQPPRSSWQVEGAFSYEDGTSYEGTDFERTSVQRTEAEVAYSTRLGSFFTTFAASAGFENPEWDGTDLYEDVERLRLSASAMGRIAESWTGRVFISVGSNRAESSMGSKVDISDALVWTGGIGGIRSFNEKLDLGFFALYTASLANSDDRFIVVPYIRYQINERWSIETAEGIQAQYQLGPDGLQQLALGIDFPGSLIHLGEGEMGDVVQEEEGFALVFSYTLQTQGGFRLEPSIGWLFSREVEITSDEGTLYEVDLEDGVVFGIRGGFRF